MNFNKKYFLALPMLTAAFALTSCSDDENENFVTDPEETVTDASFYIVNSGSYYYGIDGSLDYVSVEGDTAYTYNAGVFKKATGISLGNTPQDALVYGSKLYIAVYGSNRVFVLDKNTLSMVQEIEVSEPRDIVACDGKVYVDNYGGTVSRIDTTSLSIEKTVEVGPNPEEMAIANGYLYVTNSDGMNYGSSYANGLTVSKVNLSTFEEEKKIPVGLNPTKAVATENGNVFIVAMGDYYLTPATVQLIDANDNVTDVCAGTNLAVVKNNLYVLNAPFGATDILYSNYAVSSNGTATLVTSKALEDIVYTSCFSVSPVNSDVYVGSYSMGDYGYADYTADGYVNIYNAAGEKKGQVSAGVGPCAIVY